MLVLVVFYQVITVTTTTKSSFDYSTFLFQVFFRPLEKIMKKAPNLKTGLYIGILVLECFDRILNGEIRHSLNVCMF